MKINHPLVVLDLETTGTWIEKDRIIEIALIKLHPQLPQETFHTRVNPAMAIPARVTEITGLRQEDVKDAPAFGTIAGKVLEFIGDADLGGFNIERFDLPLLAREITDAGLKIDYSQRTIYDAQKIYHLHHKRDLSAAFSFYCQKDLKDAHSALADTQASLDILVEQVKRYGDGVDNIEALKVFDYEPNNEFCDADRKFRWWNGDLYMTFGKYARKDSLKSIAKKDPNYLQWILEKDFSDEIKSIIQGVLNGQYPKQEAT